MGSNDFQKPILLPPRVVEEGRARAFLEKKSQHSGSVLRRVSAGSQTVHFSVWMHSRDTRLRQLHGNDPWPPRTPTGLRPRGYMALREVIIAAPNIQEHINKQTHIPVDIVYKFPGKLRTMQEIHLYVQLTLLALICWHTLLSMAFIPLLPS